VQAVKGRDKVTIPGVIATVQAKLADRFDVTKTDIEDRIENLVATGVLQKGLSAGASLANDATFCVWLAPDPSDDGGVEESKSFAGEGESETKSGDPVTDAEAMPPIKSPSLMRQYSVDDNIRTSVLHPESSVQVLTGDLLVDRLLTKSQSISEVLGITVSEAEILGAAYDWDVTAVVSNYVRDAAKTRGDAGLSVIPSRAPAVTLPGTVSCIVCTDEVDGSAAFALWCGHTFCNDCWGQHVRSQVEEAKVPVRCMMAKCNAHVSSFDLPRVGMGQEDVTSFRTALSHLFVSASKKTIGACKNPLGCDGVLQASKQYGSTAVTCGKCSHAFCSECEFPPHSPVSCLARVLL